jgi:hypothetical protein
MGAAFTTTSNVETYVRPPMGPTGNRQPYMVVGFGLSPGEAFYGLGERFGPFVKNGQVIGMPALTSQTVALPYSSSQICGMKMVEQIRPSVSPSYFVAAGTKPLRTLPQVTRTSLSI